MKKKAQKLICVDERDGKVEVLTNNLQTLTTPHLWTIATERDGVRKYRVPTQGMPDIVQNAIRTMQAV